MHGTIQPPYTAIVKLAVQGTVWQTPAGVPVNLASLNVQASAAAQDHSRAEVMWWNAVGVLMQLIIHIKSVPQLFHRVCNWTLLYGVDSISFNVAAIVIYRRN